jgi:hypothetical protein
MINTKNKKIFIVDMLFQKKNLLRGSNNNQKYQTNNQSIL